MNQGYRPFIIHSDGTIFVERRYPDASNLCTELQALAYCVKETEPLCTYRFAFDARRAHSGKQRRTAEEWIDWLQKHSKVPVPTGICQQLRAVLAQPADQPETLSLAGNALAIQLAGSERFAGLRDYQQQAVMEFADQIRHSKGGVILLPCGAGKTVVGLGVMAQIKKETIILAPNTTSVQQWKRELLSKTSLSETDVGIYTAEEKRIRPITITTYQMLTYRDAEEEYPHLQALCGRSWGLVIYDEVHMLPAPVFRLTAELQADHRLGLTATLVREDGKEKEVFSLIGPLVYHASWKELERDGWIREAICREMHVPLSPQALSAYRQATKKQRVRIAAENRHKLQAVAQLLTLHHGEQILIIGHYLRQLEQIAEQLKVPLITGHMSQARREEWYQKFRAKEVPVLVVSKVANLAVDLPTASVGIQVSGTYGSRQEEAQRLGRLLRNSVPGQKAYFYQLVTENTVEEEYAWRRQCFLAEQGYQYERVRWEG